MPLKGEYEPNPVQFVRDQVELYESSGGTQATTLGFLAGPDDARLRDLPVVILTTLGAKSGKVRKTPLMRGGARWHLRRGRVYGRSPQPPGLVPQSGRRPPGGTTALRPSGVFTGFTYLHAACRSAAPDAGCGWRSSVVQADLQTHCESGAR